MNRPSLRSLTALAACVATAALLAACGAAERSVGPGDQISVVAAESVWGSIASQLGGSHVTVRSIIANPDTDPHDYEPTAADARALASAQLVVINGVGYDPWAPKLLAAEPDRTRTLLTVGALVGVPASGNPHRWYAPGDVARVIDQLTADYRAIDPADTADFNRLHAAYSAGALARYSALIAEIRVRYAGTPVGASESVFAPLADALGLQLATPASFLRAISQGSDPTAADKTAIDTQIRSRAIKVYVYNSQNATPDVAAQVAEARAQGIPVTTITETLVPVNGTFQDWQVSQLVALERALAQATGR